MGDFRYSLWEEKGPDKDKRGCPLTRDSCFLNAVTVLEGISRMHGCASLVIRAGKVQAKT